MERDDALRSACFLALDSLRAEFGEDVPYRAGLDRGFAFGGTRIPFLTYQKGIYRAALQRGTAALSINTSFRSPYDDEITDLGFVYAYRSGAVDQVDNRALRSAFELHVPIAYFVGVRPGWYYPVYPAFVVADYPAERRVLVSPTPVLQGTAVLGSSTVEQAWAVRQARVRLHQARFRGMVLPAYRERCAICRLREVRLLDAAHVVPDTEPGGAAAVANGVSLCSIHHRAFDQDLVGIAPDHRVHVARRLQDEEDGPMLELLKGFHGQRIVVPRIRGQRPDPARLTQRFERFRAREA